MEQRRTAGSSAPLISHPSIQSSPGDSQEASVSDAIVIASRNADDSKYVVDYALDDDNTPNDKFFQEQRRNNQNRAVEESAAAIESNESNLISRITGKQLCMAALLFIAPFLVWWIIKLHSDSLDKQSRICNEDFNTKIHDDGMEVDAANSKNLAWLGVKEAELQAAYTLYLAKATASVASDLVGRLYAYMCYHYGWIDYKCYTRLHVPCEGRLAVDDLGCSDQLPPDVKKDCKDSCDERPDWIDVYDNLPGSDGHCGQIISAQCPPINKVLADNKNEQQFWRQHVTAIIANRNKAFEEEKAKGPQCPEDEFWISNKTLLGISVPAWILSVLGLARTCKKVENASPSVNNRISFLANMNASRDNAPRNAQRPQVADEEGALHYSP